jgi:hypothetical protein
MQIVRDWTFQVKDGLEETLRGGRKSLTRRKINLPEDRYVEMLYEQGDVSSVSAHLSFLFETVDKWPATSIRIWYSTSQNKEKKQSWDFFSLVLTGC